MRKQQQGFTLIELMIVVAIIAILAAIAIPLYLNYTNRAKLSATIVKMGPAKTAVAEYYSTNGRFPGSNASAGLSSPTSYAGPATASVTVGAGGRITALTSGASGNLPPPAQGKTIILSPVVAGGGASITWICKKGTTPPQYLPANCRNP